METNSSKRIEWIDALRGFAIVLVVFSHVEHFGYGYLADESLIRNIIITFYMPLFFFISGFMAYRPDVSWSKNRLWALSLEKMRKIIIPTLVFGLFFSVTVYAYQRGYVNSLRGIGSFIVDGAKNGYWFTISLFEMFVIYFLVRSVAYLRSIKNKKTNINNVLVVLSILFYLIYVFFTNEHIVNNGQVLGGTRGYLQLGMNVLCLPRTFHYFQFFIFGIMLAQKKEVLVGLLHHRYSFVISFSVWLVAFMISSCSNSTLLFQICRLLSGYSGIIILLSCFYSCQDTFSLKKPVGRVLQYIGKRTLDIYLIHFFFLPTLPMLGKWFIDYSNVTIEFFVTMVLSSLIIMLCLIVSSILRISPFIEYCIFGVKNSPCSK